MKTCTIHQLLLGILENRDKEHKCNSMCKVFLKNAQTVHIEQCINIYLGLTTFKEAERCKCCVLLVLLTDMHNNNFYHANNISCLINVGI